MGSKIFKQSLNIGSKGFNQVDLAVAMGLMLAMMTFVIIYTNSFISPQVSATESSRLRTTASILGDIIFDERGIPENWTATQEAIRPSLMEYIYSVPVTIFEFNGTSRTNAVISVNLTTDEHAYNGSVKVYEGNMSLNTNITYNGDTDSDGYLEWMNVSFMINVSSRQTKIVHVYYSSDNTTNAAYTLLTLTQNNTYNITTLGEERITGFTPTKLSSINNKSADYLKPRFGTRHEFRIEVENVSGSTYFAGGTLPTTTTVAANERRVPSQNKTGFINSVRATLWVW